MSRSKFYRYCMRCEAPVEVDAMGFRAREALCDDCEALDAMEKDMAKHAREIEESP